MLTITVAEYVEWRQPEIFALLEVWQGMTQVVAAKEEHPFVWWKRLMEERPKPGRGGLLRGENAV